MTPQQQAEKLAMEAAGKIYVKAKLNRINEYSMRDDILSTIPLKEMLDCCEALQRVWNEDECGWITGANSNTQLIESVACGKCNGEASRKEDIVHEDYCTQGFIDKALSGLNAKLKGTK